ncbi:aldo/keto reductase [Levilactobacillus bambusae]|uniref:Aldo/keto reductase n=1 Tax=Levilactobacillus bambusae TaxID=2024736 RepID=A0A2V1MYX5_9LACO|nr:aldo/keto reductase [Levilactobacillus bambusae]PWG00211.1 aldo/keto reductase [Levilactobacillus bambusae]
MVYVAADNRYEQLPIRRAGHTGMQLPLFSLGLWRNFGSEADYDNSRQTVLTAFDHGIFSFDLANNYGPKPGSAEETFGQIMSHDLRPYRDELVVSTKAGFPMWPGPYGSGGGTRKYLMNSLDQSLTRLHMDYVDIFYSHRPDPDTAFEETAEALADIVRSGKALYIGISNYDTDQTKAMVNLLKERRVPFVLNQFSYNMLNQEAETTGLLDTLAQEDAGLIAYGPLAEGLLSDRYLDGIPSDFPVHRTNKRLFENGSDALVKKLNQLNDLAKNRGQSLSQLAEAWLLKSHTVTSIILGTSHTNHLLDDLKAVNNLDLSQDELTEINHIIND